jgi:hypothetical protein
MPYYFRLRNKNISQSARVRTVEGLQRLRKQIRNHIPNRTVRDTLLLATWNLRDLGNEDKRFEEGEGPGPRLNESYYYIAEIISAFDLVSIGPGKSTIASVSENFFSMKCFWISAICSSSDFPNKLVNSSAFRLEDAAR